jgi:hypothetical protein
MRIPPAGGPPGQPAVGGQPWSAMMLSVARTVPWAPPRRQSGHPLPRAGCAPLRVHGLSLGSGDRNQVQSRDLLIWGGQAASSAAARARPRWPSLRASVATLWATSTSTTAHSMCWSSRLPIPNAPAAVAAAKGGDLAALSRTHRGRVSMSEHAPPAVGQCMQKTQSLARDSCRFGAAFTPGCHTNSPAPREHPPVPGELLLLATTANPVAGA